MRWLTRVRPRRHRQQGQALIEFAMFITALMVLLAGLVDIGTLLNDHMDVVYAARQGARTGSVLGKNLNADCSILDAVQSALLNQPNMTATRIVIFDADTVTGASTGAADVYAAPFNCASPSSTGWPPSARSDRIYHEDSLGVEVDYTYQFEFNWFGGGPLAGSDQAVFPIGPPSGGA
jgi:hypothetical protein